MNSAAIELAAPTAHPALRGSPSKLFVEVTTRCNLRCAMCIKHAPGRAIAEGNLSQELFARLAPAFPRLDALILNGIGEPLLHPQLERFVEAGKQALPAHGWVGFQTNGQLLHNERARSLVRAGVDRVCISADAVSPELFRALRAGGKQEAVEAAAAALHGAARECHRDVSIGVEFVAVRDNVKQLPELVRWAGRNHVRFVIVTHMVPYREQAVGDVAYETNTDRALQLVRMWRQRANAEDIDLDRYFQVFMGFKPSPSDRRVVDAVKAMVADASAQDLSVNLRRLLLHDELMLRGVREAFAEAEEVARSEGIDLRLPAVVPTRERRCEFVEAGGAFVSWDGDVRPCYFLWHRYHTYLGGVVKQVEPKTFGNLREQGLVAIWNSPEWRQFREQVLRYDFPFCYDCNLSLCDYVDSGDFTQDCHMSEVPCGACLWCTGLFQCLQ